MPVYFENYPCQELPIYLDTYYVFKLSLHLYELMYACIYYTGRYDFPEYILHHIFTLVLVLFSYSINFLPIGAVIMFVHDFTDTFVCICKLSSDVTSMSTEMTTFSMMFMSWIYYRLWFFPNFLIKNYYREVYNSSHFVI